jgi:AmpD protein
LIRRDGELVQYVSFDQRAWHAGVSQYEERESCNDFSMGIELEGTDTLPYTDAQYATLQQVTALLLQHYPLTPARITGHSDIAPERKTDPGSSFDWLRYKESIRQENP